MDPVSYLRPAQASKMLGISRSCLYRWMHVRADFPKPARLSPKCTVFDAAEIVAYVQTHKPAQANEAGKNDTAWFSGRRAPAATNNPGSP